jgi:hypothetical protein
LICGKPLRELLPLVKFAPLMILLAALSASCAGCIWLAIPGLAYTGYQISNGKFPGLTQASGKPTHQPQPTDQNSASSDHSIE